MTICVGELKFARATRPMLAAQITSRTSAGVRPKTADIPPRVRCGRQLHRLSALADDAQRVVERKRPGDNEAAEFGERVACGYDRCEGIADRGVEREIRREDRRLAELRFTQLLFGTLALQCEQIVTEQCGGPLEERSGGRRSLRRRRTPCRRTASPDQGKTTAMRIMPPSAMRPRPTRGRRRMRRRRADLAGFTRPARTVSESAIGIDAADVLPYSAMLTTTFSSGKVEVTRRCVDDAPVRLMRNQERHVGFGEVRLFQHRVGRVDHLLHRELERLAPLHVNEMHLGVERGMIDRLTRPAALGVKQFGPASVGTQIRGEKAVFARSARE